MGLNVPDCVANNPTALRTAPSRRPGRSRPDLPTVYATEAAAGSVPLIDMDSLICGRSAARPSSAMCSSTRTVTT